MDPGTDIKPLEAYESDVQGERIFSYKGTPTTDTIHFILQFIESKLNLVENNQKVKKKIINILVEVLQNILHHLDEFAKLDFNSFVFLLFRRKDSFRIVAGNYIPKSKAGSLVDRIRNYRSLTKNELKQVYRKVLGNAAFDHSGRAGLGLMDIIRKSGGNIEHQLIPADDEHYFFLLEITVNYDPNE